MKKPKQLVSLKNYQYPDKFGKWLGYKIKTMKDGVANVTLTLREDHLSPAGRVHGGVISAFFDFACGAAVFSTMNPDDFCSTIELKVSYFKPMVPGDVLTCRSEVMFRGNRLCSVLALLYRKGQKKQVAMATATFNIIAGKK